MDVKNEQRLELIGPTLDGRLLQIAFVLMEGRVRVISACAVALDKTTIQELKVLAEAQGIPYQVLIRVFILDGLDRLKKSAA
jgi:uncharacterized DUF497 family protein